MAAAPNLAPSADLATLYRAHIDHLIAAYGKAITAAGLDALVIGSGRLRPKSPFDDQDWPFRPTPAFAHWLPLREHDCALVIKPFARPRLLRAAVVGFWDGPTPIESDHFWSAFDVEEIEPSKVAGELPRGKVAFLGDVAEQAPSWGIDPQHANPPGLISAIDAIRTRKTPYELHCLTEASRRSAAGHRRVVEAFHQDGPSELQLHLQFLSATEQDDPQTPYKGIVAIGPNAAVLHHVHYGRTRARASDSLLIDAGATYLGYGSDISRTTVKGDSAAAQQFAALIDRIEALHLECCRRVRPGLNYEALHDQAHELMAPIVRDLGLIDASDDELVASGATRVFLPHGLGHSLGIQTHDVGCRRILPRTDNPFLRNTSTIEVGQVFTIEPGFYFIPSLLEELRSGPIASRVNWSAIDALRPFGGVRIEDNLAVLEGEVRNLTRETWEGRR